MLARKLTLAVVLSLGLLLVGCGPILGAVAGVIGGIVLINEVNANNLPSIQIAGVIVRTASSVNTGLVDIPVGVIDADKQNVTIAVSWATSPAGPFTAATVTGNVIKGSATGTLGIIQWDAATDFGAPGGPDYSYHASAVLRLTPTDSASGKGTAITTTAFEVGNDVPVISNVSSGGTTVRGNTVVSYDVSDSSNDVVSMVGFSYSDDGFLTSTSLTVPRSAAQGTLQLAVNPTDGDTLTIDAVTYHFATTLSSAGDIQIGASLAATQASLVATINGTGTAGTDYFAGTITPIGSVTAAAFSGNNCVLTAATQGTAGNSLALTSSFTSASNTCNEAAQGTLKLTANPFALDTVTIDSVTYRFVSVLTLANDVQLGASLAATQASLVATINGTGTAGVDYQAGTTTPHPTVSAATFVSNKCVMTARTGGSAGNSIATTSSFFNAANTFDAATLGTTKAGVTVTTLGGTRAGTGTTTTDFPVGTFFNIDASTGGVTVNFGWDTAASPPSQNATLNNVEILIVLEDSFGAQSSTLVSGPNDPFSNSFDINNSLLSGDPASLAFDVEPSGSYAAGAAISPNIQIRVRDSSNTSVTTPTRVLLVTTGVNVLKGATEVTTNSSGVAVFTSVWIEASGSYQIQASLPDWGGAGVIVSTSFSITGATADHFDMTTVSSPVTAGSFTTLTVTARDQYNNVATSYVGTVNFESSDSNAALPPSGAGNSYTFTVGDSGVHTFSGSDRLQFQTTGTHFIRVVDNADSTIDAVQTGIVVNAGATASLTFATQPPVTTDAGVTFPIVVNIFDSFGNLRNVSTTVTLSGLNGATIVPSANPSVNTSTGVASFTSGEVAVQVAGSGFQIRATVGAVTADSTTFTIFPADVSTVVITTAPTTVDAGSVNPTTVQVTLRDAFTNLVTDQSVAVTIQTVGVPNRVVSGGSSTSSGGIASFSSMIINVAGTYTLTATAASITSAASSSFTINPANPVSMAFATGPSTIVAGVTFGSTVTVNVLDAYSNLVTDQNLTLTMESTGGGGGAVTGSTTRTTGANGFATFPGISIQVTGTSYRLRALQSTYSLALNSGTFNVNAAAPSVVVFTSSPPSSIGSGASFSATIRLNDAFGNLCDNGTYSVTITERAGVVAVANGGPVNVSVGTHTFGSLQIATAGTSYQLRATITSPSVVSDDANTFDIVAGTPDHLTITQGGQNVDAGVVFPLAVTVEVRDANNNICNNVIKAVSVVTTGVDRLIGDKTVNTVNGIATFTNLSVQLVGGAYTLQATSPSVTSASVGTFAIAPAAPATLAFTTNPGNIVANVAFGSSPVVEVRDAFNNLVTDQNLAITLSALDGGGGALVEKVAGAATVQTLATGIATFPNLTINTIGTAYRLLATQSAIIKASSTFNVTPAGVASLAFTTQPAASVAAGANITTQVTMRDAFGNTVNDSSTHILLAVTGGAATLNGSTDVQATAGVSNFTSNITTTGSYTLTASIVSPALSVASTGITITADPGTHVLAFFTQPPASTVESVVFGNDVVVEVRDTFGNRVTTGADATASITLTLSVNPGALSGGGPKAAVAGLCTFSGLTVNVPLDGYMLTASATGPTSGNSTTFDIESLPVITAVAPYVIRDGCRVVITGTGFTSSTAADYLVDFNGLSVVPSSVTSPTTLTCTAPTGVTAGSMTVTLVATSSAFTYTTGPTRANLAGGGAQSLLTATEPVVSDDGRYVAFVSSDRLAGYPGTLVASIFRFDVKTHTIARVSVTPADAIPDGACSEPAISADGRYIAFTSVATDLVASDTNSVADIFVRDMNLPASTGTTRVSLTNAGAQIATAASSAPDISGAGTRIVFVCQADLDGSGTTRAEVWMRDTSAGTTTRISQPDPGGATIADGNSGEPAISPDGLFVAFSVPGTTTNLVQAGDTGGADSNSDPDIYVRDLVNSRTIRASLRDTGAQETAATVVISPDISDEDAAGGRYVSFLVDDEWDDNLTGTFVANQVIVRDILRNTTERLTFDTAGAELNAGCTSATISRDGSRVAYASAATDAISSDANGAVIDVFVRDRAAATTIVVSVDSANEQGTTNPCSLPCISGDGLTVVFVSSMTDLVTGDTNGVADVFVAAAR